MTKFLPAFRAIAAVSAVLLPATSALAQSTDLELWRLDCGRIEVNQLNAFSDTFAYPDQKMTLTDSCYLIRHGTDYMMWDTGLPAALLDAPTDPQQPLSPTLDKDLPSQLAEIGVAPEAIGRVGISHYHFDHTGQAATFAKATLLIGTLDLDALKSDHPPMFADPKPLAPWISGGGKVEEVASDMDVFGDGSVVILAMPGHTPGEKALLVNLPETGPMLLSGDVVHFQEQLANQGVPAFNFDRSESLASMDRLSDMADNLKATLIIQHDARDVAKLPAFPASAK